MPQPKLVTTNDIRPAAIVLTYFRLAFSLRRLLKQEPKARNHLKRISKMQYNTEEADELERSYLLLADMYIQSNKNDLAQELCRRSV